MRDFNEINGVVEKRCQLPPEEALQEKLLTLLTDASFPATGKDVLTKMIF